MYLTITYRALFLLVVVMNGIRSGSERKDELYTKVAGTYAILLNLLPTVQRSITQLAVPYNMHCKAAHFRNDVDHDVRNSDERKRL